VRAAADRSDITASMRINFLLSQAFSNAERNQFGEAASLMDKVVGIRRASTDWQLLGDFSRAAGQNKQAAEAFEKMLQISPTNPGPRRWLIEHYDRANERDKAELHQRALSLMESWQRQHGSLK
jgi:Tfp pilus assembly protein PilF